MTINQFRRLLHKTNVLAGDYQAVKRGRIAERVTNRVAGRVVFRPDEVRLEVASERS